MHILKKTQRGVFLLQFKIAAAAGLVLLLLSGCRPQEMPAPEELSSSVVSREESPEDSVKAVPYPPNDVLGEGVLDHAQAAVVYCPDTKEVLYGHALHEERPIASITKIMTAVLGLEAPDREVTITPAMYAEGSSLYLKAGEVLMLSELVRGMMVVSGNDAANAVALATAGSEEAFADRMNEKASSLGMRHSHFVTPSGLDSPGHYSSAYDMALLCAYAMEQEAFAQVVSQKKMTLQYVLPEGRQQELYNHNRLLAMCSGCVGIKTGYTQKAGRTLTSCAERDGRRLIIVTLHDPQDWDDHCALYDHFFAQLSEEASVLPETEP